MKSYFFYVAAAPFWFVAIRALVRAGVKADILALLVLFVTGVVVGESLSFFHYSSAISNGGMREGVWLPLVGGGLEEFLRAMMVAFLLRKSSSEVSGRLVLAVAAVYSAAENVVGFSAEYRGLPSGASGEIYEFCSFSKKLLYCQNTYTIILVSLSQSLKFFSHFILVFVSSQSILSRRFGIFFLVVLFHAMGNAIGGVVSSYYPIFSAWMGQVLLSLAKVVVLSAIFSSFMREQGFVWTPFLRGLLLPTPGHCSSEIKGHRRGEKKHS